MFLICKKNHPKNGQIKKVYNNNNARQEDEKIIKNKAMAKGAIIVAIQDKKTTRNRKMVRKATTIM
jgi:hypothetical protein